MAQVVIGIGSNIEPDKHVPAAVEEIARAHHLLARSRFVATAPVGPPGQPQFLNGAVLIETELSRPQLRDWLRQLEHRLGRTRGPDRYAPRTIDLDIAVWDGQIVDPDVRTRPYLRTAVSELLPDLRL